MCLPPTQKGAKMESIVIEPGYAKRHPIIVRPQNRSYLEDKRWIKTAKGYEGYYQTKYGVWKGKIEKGPNSWEFYIFNPPESLLHGEHENCFRFEGNGWYWIHWQDKPRMVSDGIMAMERVIIESYRQLVQPRTRQSWWRNLLGGNHETTEHI